jgi:dTMP kinase
MLVAIEGIDGAGKGTLTRNLLALAERDGVDAASLSFPRYEETAYSALIAQYLNGRFGKIDDVPVRFAALLYAGDRFESRPKLEALVAAHQLVILDRYVASNMAYNAAKLPAGERQDLLDWLDETEFGIFGLPRPDLTCLVGTRPDVADALVARKDARSYTQATRDLHEADRGFMAEVADVYDTLAAKDGSWLRVDPLDGEGNLRTPEDIADEVWAAIKQRLD